MISIQDFQKAVDNHPDIKIRTRSMIQVYDNDICCCALGIIALDSLDIKEFNVDNLEDISLTLWDWVDEKYGEKQVGDFYLGFDDGAPRNTPAYYKGKEIRNYCIKKGYLPNATV